MILKGTITEDDILDTIYSNVGIQNWNVAVAANTITNQMTIDIQPNRAHYIKLMKRVRRVSKRLFDKRKPNRINSSSPMTKEMYKTFLRLNDRKQTQWADDFRKAKYHEAIPNDKTVNGEWRYIHTWCDEKFGPHGYTWTGEIWWFENERDKLMFLLRWG